MRRERTRARLGLAGLKRSPFKIEKIWIWCQAHTGARGLNNRGRERVERDWQKMKLMETGASVLKGSERAQTDFVRMDAPLRRATSVKKYPDHLEAPMWKGTVEGQAKKTRWTGEVELDVDGVSVTGFIKWKSDRGHCGTVPVNS